MWNKKTQNAKFYVHYNYVIQMQACWQGSEGTKQNEIIM